MPGPDVGDHCPRKCAVLYVHSDVMRCGSLLYFSWAGVMATHYHYCLLIRDVRAGSEEEKWQDSALLLRVSWLSHKHVR